MWTRDVLPVVAFYLGCAFWGASIGIVFGSSPSRASVAAKAVNVESKYRSEKTIAISRINEPGWKKRFEAINEQARRGDAEVIFLGDSITAGWRYTAEWQERFGRYNPMNAGISSDRVEHLLWRVRHGNLDNLQPTAAVLLIGVNNLAVSSPEEIASGVKQVTTEIHRRSPKTEVIVLGVFPSGKEKDHPRRAKIHAVNRYLASLDKLAGVSYVDIGQHFLEADGSISKEVMPDYLHLSPHGYKIWADALEPVLSRKMYTK